MEPVLPLTLPNAALNLLPAPWLFVRNVTIDRENWDVRPLRPIRVHVGAIRDQSTPRLVEFIRHLIRGLADPQTRLYLEAPNQPQLIVINPSFSNNHGVWIEPSVMYELGQQNHYTLNFTIYAESIQCYYSVAVDGLRISHPFHPQDRLPLDQYPPCAPGGSSAPSLGAS